MSNAFAPIVRARPNPIFGRPVHQGSLPFDYSPILLLKPFGFRIAPDTLSSGIRRATGSRSVLAVSGFRPRARLDFSIPSCSPGQRGITPAFGYSAPHPSAEGTSTPMIHALPSAHYGLIRLLIHVHARRAACRLPEPARHTSPGMHETSQVPRKELLHVRCGPNQLWSFLGTKLSPKQLRAPLSRVSGVGVCSAASLLRAANQSAHTNLPLRSRKNYGHCAPLLIQARTNSPADS